VQESSIFGMCLSTAFPEAIFAMEWAFFDEKG